MESHQYLRLKAELESSSRVLVVAHKKPDGDTLGSSSAIYLWLKSIGKDVTIFCRDLPPQIFAYLPTYVQFTDAESVFDKNFDTIVVMDSGNLNYCGIDTLIQRQTGNPKIINIDHHPVNANFGNFNLVDMKASSTAEVVADFFKLNDIIMVPDIATCLLTGIFTDTSHFTNSATQSSTAKVAAGLISAGADLNLINRNLLNNKSTAVLNIWGLALSRLKFNPAYKLAVTALVPDDFKKLNIDVDVKDNLSNFLNAYCSDAEIIMVIYDMGDGNIRCSLRSINSDVAKFAKFFGGGGHIRAAGFTIPGKLQITEKSFKII